MPKWGACWGMVGLSSFLTPEADFDEDVGHRDVYITYCQIDHVASVESADPDVFIYCIQEVIHILLSQRDSMVAKLSGKPPEVYSGVVEAAWRMRELAVKQHRAFWTSGYEADRVRLIETMRRCQLPSDSPEFTLPPHVQHLRRALQVAREMQLRQFHRLAQSAQLDKDTRRRLHEIPAT